MIFSGSYADNSGCDWRSGLSALIFALALCIVGMMMLGASAAISLMIGTGAFPLVLIGIIALVLQVITKDSPHGR